MSATHETFVRTLLAEGVDLYEACARTMAQFQLDEHAAARVIDRVTGRGRPRGSVRRRAGRPTEPARVPHEASDPGAAAPAEDVMVDASPESDRPKLVGTADRFSTLAVDLPPPALPHGRSLTERELGLVPAPRWEHDGWTQRGGCVLIVGPPGSFKTVMVAGLLGASAIGGASFGVRALRRGPVYAVIGEDLGGWQARWQAWRRAARVPDGVTLPLHTFADDVNLFTGENFEALLTDVEAVNPCVLAVDPLSDLIAGAEENSAKDMGLVRNRFKKLMRGGRTLLVSAHTGWDESRERGSTVMRGFADTRLVLRANERGEVLVRCRKQRNGRAFDPVTLQFDPESLVLGDAARAPAVVAVSESLRAAVLDWVQAHPDMATDAVARGLGRRKADVVVTLGQLRAAGAVVSEPKGRGSTWRTV